MIAANGLRIAALAVSIVGGWLDEPAFLVAAVVAAGVAGAVEAAFEPRRQPTKDLREVYRR